MPKPFDATTKFLVETHPADWVSLLGLPYAEARLLDTDLSTVTATADTLLWVETEPPYLLVLDFQGNVDSLLESRLLLYRTLVRQQHPRVRIECALILLRPFARHRTLTGIYREQGRDGEPDILFRYRVLRVWEMPASIFLAGGIATLPLAMVANTRKKDLPELLHQVESRLKTELKPSEAERLRTATYVLLGLKYDPSFVEKLMSKNVLELSSTYQALLKEGLEKGLEQGREQGREQGLEQGLEQGREQGVRASLLRIGRRRLGEPTPLLLTKINAVGELATLEALLDTILEAQSWDELLQRAPD